MMIQVGPIACGTTPIIGLNIFAAVCANEMGIQQYTGGKWVSRRRRPERQADQRRRSQGRLTRRQRSGTGRRPTGRRPTSCQDEGANHQRHRHQVRAVVRRCVRRAARPLGHRRRQHPRPVHHRSRPRQGRPDRGDRPRRRAHLSRFGRRQLRQRRPGDVHRLLLRRAAAHRRPVLPPLPNPLALVEGDRQPVPRRRRPHPTVALAHGGLTRRPDGVLAGDDHLAGPVRGARPDPALPDLPAAAARAAAGQGRRLDRPVPAAAGDRPAPVHLAAVHRGPAAVLQGRRARSHCPSASRCPRSSSSSPCW